MRLAVWLCASYYVSRKVEVCSSSAGHATLQSEVFLFRSEELEYFCGPQGGARSLARGAWDSFAGWLPWAKTRSARAIAAAFRRAALGGDKCLGCNQKHSLKFTSLAKLDALKVPINF